MKNLRITDTTERKLREKHGVSRNEVEQCFANRIGRLLEDQRAQHKTQPPTLWFLPRTNRGRILKVVYIQHDQAIHLKSAYPPNADELAIYAKYGDVSYLPDDLTT